MYLNPFKDVSGSSRAAHQHGSTVTVGVITITRGGRSMPFGHLCIALINIIIFLLLWNLYYLNETGFTLLQ